MKRAASRTMSLAMAWMAVAMALAACQTSPAATVAKSATPQSIALQPNDVPDMQRCAVSGDVASVLKQEKAQSSPSYDRNATEWEQWKRQGATDAYFAVFGRTASDCAAASNASTGAPTGGLMVALVVEFRDTNGAARNFQRDSTLMGLGPGNIRFIQLAGGTTTYGQATGLGEDSAIGNAVVGGANYFVAMWQSKSFQSEFISYDLNVGDADTAVLAVNQRILQT